jgi:hypothetical protein
VKNMKWLVGLGILVSLIVAATALTALAQAPIVGIPTVSVQVAECAAPEGGGFTASIDITTVEGFSAAQFDVMYNSGALELVGVSGGELDGSPLQCVEWAWVPSDQVNTGRIRVVVDPGDPEPAVPGDMVLGASGSGYLAELHFNIVGACGETGTIGLVDGSISDAEAGEITATWMDELVTIFKPGDADMDCAIDGRDVIRAKKIILELEEETCGADANQDDEIDGQDILAIKKMILGY